MTDAYAAYWDVSTRAAGLPRDQGWAVLAPYSEPEHTEQLLERVGKWQRKGIEPWGYVVAHAQSVKVNGSTARLLDCQDASHAAVAKAKTHAVISGTTGSPDVHIAADMQHDPDGRWRLKQLTILETPCSAQRS
ncbi:hypothetical protein EBO15_33095 [Actinomadura harenae]|uniref:SnoaL-like domain-containing protein n=1 Tax=Actinomadura harenae TaxID=2483351 RepID=A0A3M2LMJ8_9ACTN|nr:hypothetical protein EBO15_33095 [Actinomadura harenae]